MVSFHSGDCMIHREAERLTSFCVSRGWLDTEYYEWCIYAIEKRLCILLFSIIVVIWSLLSKLYLETVGLSLTLYTLRSRFGGWHAKSLSLCLVTSTGLISGLSILSFIVSRYISKEHLLIVGMIVTCVGLNLDPVYPSQTHVTQEEAEINKRKKNKLLILIFCVQLLLSLFNLQQISASIFFSIYHFFFFSGNRKNDSKEIKNENEP